MGDDEPDPSSLEIVSQPQAVGLRILQFGLGGGGGITIEGFRSDLGSRILRSVKGLASCLFRGSPQTTVCKPVVPCTSRAPAIHQHLSYRCLWFQGIWRFLGL